MFAAISEDMPRIRRNPPEVEFLGISEIGKRSTYAMSGRERKPTIMGHSFDGLIAQILLDLGWGKRPIKRGEAANGPSAGSTLRPRRSHDRSSSART